MLKRTAAVALAHALTLGLGALPAQTRPAVISGPVGPSPYNVVHAWHKPFSEPGFAFGGNSGRVRRISRPHSDRPSAANSAFPIPCPPSTPALPAPSASTSSPLPIARVMKKNFLYVLDANGNVREHWSQWDHLFADATGPGPHRIRVSPYDPQHRVWVIDESYSVIYVFSNDGSKLLKTLGEKGVEGADGTHFGKPQDVAFLPDGRILIADGLDNHRVMILNRDMKYIGELFGGHGKGPGQFDGVHAIAVGPEGRVFAHRPLRSPHQTSSRPPPIP